MQPIGRHIRFAKALRQHQRMVIEIVGSAIHPTGKLSALFKSGVTLADKLGFTDAKCQQRAAHRRPGAFADANRRHAGGFNQNDSDRAGLTIMFGRNAAGGQPTGIASADDHDSLDRLLCRVIVFVLGLRLHEGLPALHRKNGVSELTPKQPQ